MSIESEIYKYKSNKNLNEYIDKYVFTNMYKDNFKKVADDMLNNKYYLPNIGYTQDLYNESYNRSTLRLIHGFAIIYPLIKIYKETKDKRYILKCISMVDNWINRFRYPECKKSMAFHDETTALRLTHLIYLFDVSKNMLDIDEIKSLYLEIKDTAKLLSLPSFYSENTNHGFFQDLSLIIYSKYFNYNEDSIEYYKLGQKRIKTYFDYIFTKSGVHKEHSPEYHFLIANKTLSLINSGLIEDNEFYEYIKSIYLETCKFSTYISKPNMELPKTGDTKPGIYIDNIYKNLYEDINYKSLIDKKFNNINLDTDYIFEDAGYAILKNKWGEDAIYILFCASYHTKYHKHCDDLSFLVHYKGDIISESGPFGYMYDDDMCKYGYSSFAHNTLIVNGKSLPRVDKKYDKVKITQFELDKDKSIIKAINNRYEGIMHKRTLSFEKNNNIINIVDYIRGDKESNYTLLFHLSSEIDIKQDKNYIYMYRDYKLIGKMCFTSDDNIDIGYSYGKDDNLIKGINFPNMYEISSNYVIYININNTKTTIINTQMNIYTS